LQYMYLVHTSLRRRDHRRYHGGGCIEKVPG
jgi:hypothetical protein